MGHSKAGTKDNQVEANHCVVNLNGRHATVQHIADSMDFSIDSIHAALTDILEIISLAALLKIIGNILLHC